MTMLILLVQLKKPSSFKMKNLIIIISFLFSLSTFGQSKKEIENGIFITFPVTPDYNASTQITTYVAKTDNCLFMTIVQRNIIPNYAQYVQAKMKWSKTEIKKVEDSFLDNVVKGKLDYTGNTGIVSEIKTGEFSGRKVEYSAVNPETGERGKRYTIMQFVRDKLVNFECWFLKDNETSKTEKDQFFNSIYLITGKPTI